MIAEEVTGGSFNMTLTWSPKPGLTITLIKETLNLCDLMVDIADQCPLKSGNHSIHYHGDVPDIFPKASRATACMHSFLYSEIYTLVHTDVR